MKAIHFYVKIFVVAFRIFLKHFFKFWKYKPPELIAAMEAEIPQQAMGSVLREELQRTARRVVGENKMSLLLLPQMMVEIPIIFMKFAIWQN